METSIHITILLMIDAIFGKDDTSFSFAGSATGNCYKADINPSTNPNFDYRVA